MSAEDLKNQGQSEIEKRMRHFKGVDRAISESGIVTKLHELYSQRGVEEDYLVLDGYEMTTGFPCRVLTRYIIPVVLETEENRPLEDLFPGVRVSEVYGLGIRTIQIQIGLDADDMLKIVERAKHVIKKEKGKELEVKPYWWNHSNKVVDFTRPYNLKVDDSSQDKSKKIPKDRIPFETFLWQEKGWSGITTVVFERETKRGLEREWADQREDVNKAFNNLAEIIDELLRK